MTYSNQTDLKVMHEVSCKTIVTPLRWKNMKFDADALVYVVVSKIVDDFGISVQGIGETPLFIAANSESGESVGLYGSTLIKLSEKIHTTNGGVSEIIYQFFQEIGLKDFNSVSGMELESDNVIQLVQGAIDGDLNDFEEESGLSCYLIEPDAFRDEEFLQEYLTTVGFWVSKSEGIDVEINISNGVIVVDDEKFKDWDELVNQKLVDGDGNHCVCII